MSSRAATELAKLFIERNNPPAVSIGIGKVLSPLPNLRIQYGEQIILEMEDLVVSAAVVAAGLIAGDSAIVIPTADRQLFYVMDKVGDP